MIKRSIRSLFATVVLIAWSAAAMAATEIETEGQKFISSLTDRAIQSLTAKDIYRGERVKRFRALFNEHFAVPVIGEWVLGRNWARATPEKRTEYLKLFEDWIVVAYVDRFAEYAGESLAITRSKELDKTNVAVFSELVRPTGGAPVRIEWRVGKSDPSYKITDLIVEGVSMSVNMRSQFASVIQQNGGQVAALLRVMRDKTAALRKELGE